MELPLQKTSKLDIKYTNSSFELHNFCAELNNDIVMFQVIKMLDSVFIWIGYKKQPNLNDISLAMKNQYSPQPVSTRLLGNNIEETSKNIAAKLCKKLNKIVYVSLNVEDGKFNLPVIERRLNEEISKYPQYF